MSNNKTDKRKLRQISNITTTRKYLMVSSAILVILLFCKGTISKIDTPFGTITLDESKKTISTKDKDYALIHDSIKYLLKNMNSKQKNSELALQKWNELRNIIQNSKPTDQNNDKLNLPIFVLVLISTYFLLHFLILLKNEGVQSILSLPHKNSTKTSGMVFHALFIFFDYHLPILLCLIGIITYTTSLIDTSIIIQALKYASIILLGLAPFTLALISIKIRMQDYQRNNGINKIKYAHKNYYPELYEFIEYLYERKNDGVLKPSDSILTEYFSSYMLDASMLFKKRMIYIGYCNADKSLTDKGLTELSDIRDHVFID